VYRLFAVDPVRGRPDVFLRWILALFAAIVMAFAIQVDAASADAPRAYAGIVLDAKTGNTLYAHAADSPRYPASVAKVMTLYVLFQELEAGRMSLNTPLTVSKHASQAVPTKLYLRPGTSIKVEDAILALVTKSANDVARVIAENISGTESQFAQRMTRTARALGMHRTTYANASGLPDRRQVSTVRDQARLGVAIYQHFPKYYEYFQRRSFRYGGNNYGNHNRLLGQMGIDGIKTGYINASGYNLLTAARQNNRHIVVAAFGFNSGGSRNAKVAELVREYMPKARSGSYWAQAVIPELENGGGNPFAVADGTPVVPVPRPESLFPKEPIAPVQVASTQPTPALPLPEPVPAQSGTPAMALAEPAPAPERRQASLTPPSSSRQPLDLMSNPAAQATANVGRATSRRPAQGPLDVIGAWLSESFELGTTRRGGQTGGNQGLVPPASIGGGSGDQTIDLMTSGSVGQTTEVDPGWVLQIGATPSEDGARRLLDDASGQVSALKDFRSYVETVDNTGQTIYRARFSGFNGRDEARALCSEIKKTNMSCLAVQS